MRRMAVVLALFLVTSSAFAQTAAPRIFNTPKQKLARGEQIVGVVAETPASAAEAASKVKIAFEELPPVFSIDEALAPGAPVAT